MRIWVAEFKNPAFGQETTVQWGPFANPRFELGSATVHPGGTVEVPLDVADNPGIVAAEMNVSYDGDKLELVEVRDRAMLKDFVKSKTLDANPYYLSWMDWERESDMTDDGTMAVLVFKAKDGLAVGDSVSLGLALKTAADKDNAGVEMAAEGAAVTVSAHEWGEPAYTWSDDRSECTAARACTGGDGAAETETARTALSTVEPTCASAGSRTWTAAFANPAFSKQALVEEIAMLPHVWDYATAGGAGMLVYHDSGCGATEARPVPDGSAVVEAADASGLVGDVVEVPVTVTGAAGLQGAKISFSYDEALLEPVSVERGDAFRELSASGTEVSMGGVNEPEAFAGDGTLFSVRFRLLAETDGTAVSLSYRLADVVGADFAPVAVGLGDGNVVAMEYLLGDVNMDGAVDLRDVVALRRHLAGWEGYAADDVCLPAADVNRDGAVDLRDAMLLRRYLASWPGSEIG